MSSVFDPAVWLGKDISAKKKTGDIERRRLIIMFSLLIDEDVEDVEQRASVLEADAEPGNAVTTSVKPWASAYAAQSFAVTHLATTAGAQIAHHWQRCCASLAPTRHLQAQFAVNFALFDFRTSLGGRLRKSAELTRGEAAHYLRPFEEELPFNLLALLAEVAHKMAQLPAAPHAPCWATPIAMLVALPVAAYCPPARYTCTIAAEVGSGDAPTASGEFSTFADVGSFGLMEPTHTAWSSASGGGLAGIRYSPGAQGTHPTVLAAIKEALQTAPVETGRYGGVGLAHVEWLLSRYAATDDLASEYALSAANTVKSVALCLTERARSVEHRRFFDALFRKIKKREVKIQSLTGLKASTSAVTPLLVVDKLGIVESTLWEFSMLAASVLTLNQLTTELMRLDSGWMPCACLDDHTIEELFVVDAAGLVPKTRLCRVLLPSATAAATGLADALDELGFQRLRVRANREAIDPFVPYFEFYIGIETLIGTNQAPRREAGPAAVWVNLSDNLHDAILEAMKLSDTVQPMKVVARLLRAYLSNISGQGLSAAAGDVLLIDHTKFSADIPSQVLWRWLADLAHELAEFECVFLKSTLKYNTGSLERYQCGEVLIASTLSDTFSKRLRPKLNTLAQSCFGDGGNEPIQAWRLFGHYLPLMRKTNVMADFINWQRWVKHSKAK